MTSHDPGGQGGEPPSEEGQDPLAEALGTLEAGLRGALEILGEGINRSVTAPLSGAFMTATQTHQRLMAEGLSAPEETGGASLSPSLDGGEPDAWALLSSYRTGVLTGVLEPVRNFLSSNNAAERLETAWASFEGDLVRLMASLPETITRSEPSDLYIPRRWDNQAIRLGKRVARARRRVGTWSWRGRQVFRRIAGKNALLPPELVQVIPLRDLARRCLEGPMALALGSFREELHQHCAKPMAALEIGVARWSREWPQVEKRLDRNTLYLSTPLREAVAERLGQIPGESGVAPAREPEKGGDEAGSAHSPPSPTGVAEELARGLAPGVVATPQTVLERMEKAIQAEWSDFLQYLEASGSFMRSSPPSRLVRKAKQARRKQEERSEIWVRWHRAVPNRVSLAIHLLRFRERITAERERLVGGVARTGLIPLVDGWRSSSEALRVLEERGNDTFAAALSAPSPDPAALSREVGALLMEGLALLDHSWLRPLAPGGIEATVRELADETSTGIAKVLPELPDALPVQAVQEEGTRVDPVPELRDVRFREIARQVFDVLKLEGVRRTPEPVVEVLSAARAEASGLPEVLRFNLEAAATQLSKSPTDIPESVIEEAASLAREGILRTKKGVDRLLQTLREAWAALTSGVEDLLDSSFREVHVRVSAEGGVQERIIGFRGRVSHRVRAEASRVRAVGEGWLGETRRAVRRVAVGVSRMVRLGRSVVGAAPAVEGEGDRALAIISQAPDLLSGLPLIYRHLFSFEPLSDEGLLRGRTRETAWVRSRFDSWRQGMGAPSLLTGPLGAGHTSFFNVLSTSLFSGTKLHRLELTERITREAVLAPRLAEMFELSDDEPWDLSRLARGLLGSSSDARPRVVFLERLEHIFLRTPGGADLFEDFLSLQVQTSGKVLWLSSMAGAAWKLVAKIEPRAASLVATHPLAPPSREELEELILARHRRSGLPLEFHAPPDLNPLVRRRLRLSRGEKVRQRILQTEYFDRLFRLSQESIPMAILHWLRSADFRSREGRLVVTAPPEIRYAFLDGLDLDLDFALKAFLEHGSLTLSEYQEVFAASKEESLQTFESLRSRLLLESTGLRQAVASVSARPVEQGVRYRIPALLSQVVARRLKDRNILH